MTKFLPAFALLTAVAAPAFASDAPTTTFTRDGRTYVYTSTPQGDATVLAGHVYPTGSAFELTVRGDSVRGRSVRGRADGMPVSFEVPAASASTPTVIASR